MRFVFRGLLLGPWLVFLLFWPAVLAHSANKSTWLDLLRGAEKNGPLFLKSLQTESLLVVPQTPVRARRLSKLVLMGKGSLGSTLAVDVDQTRLTEFRGTGNQEYLAVPLTAIAANIRLSVSKGAEFRLFHVFLLVETVDEDDGVTRSGAVTYANGFRLSRRVMQTIDANDLTAVGRLSVLSSVRKEAESLQNLEGELLDGANKSGGKKTLRAPASRIIEGLRSLEEAIGLAMPAIDEYLQEGIGNSESLLQLKEIRRELVENVDLYTFLSLIP